MNGASGPISATRRFGKWRPWVTLLAVGLPLCVVLATVAAWGALRSYEREYRSRLTNVAELAAATVDARMGTYRSAALTLAASHHLQPGSDALQLYPDILPVGQALDCFVVVSGPGTAPSQLLNSRFPLGQTPARPVAPGRDEMLAALHAAAERSGTVRFSNAFKSITIGRAIVVAVAPALFAGKARYIVSVAFEPERLLRDLGALSLPEGAFISVDDGNGVIVARSNDGERHVGQRGSEWLAAAEGKAGGVVEAMGLRGEANLFAFRRLTNAPDWVVVVGMPVNRVTLLAVQPLLWPALALVGLLALAGLALGLQWISRREEQRAYAEFEVLLGDVPAIIYVNQVWPDGRFERRFMSPSAARVSGWPWEKLSQPGALAALTDPDSVPARAAYFREALAQGRSNLEYRMQHGDGTWHWMRATCVRIRRFEDGSGELVGCVMDITQERLAKDKVDGLQKLAALGEIAAGVAHELNQPLAAISMAAQNGQAGLVRQPPAVDSAMEKFVRIVEQAHRASAVIEHIRAFGRSDEGVVSGVRLRDVLREAMVVVEARLRMAGVRLDVDLPDALLLVRAANVPLQQVLLNIVLNACDAYGDNGVEGDRVVRVRGYVEAGFVHMTIADHAGGIPEPALARIYDPFFTTKAVGKGTGLGLSISMSTVLKLGGRLEARNLDGGACFEVVLPVAA